MSRIVNYSRVVLSFSWDKEGGPAAMNAFSLGAGLSRRGVAGGEQSQFGFGNQEFREATSETNHKVGKHKNAAL
jgi:hypothetical protein